MSIAKIMTKKVTKLHFCMLALYSAYSDGVESGYLSSDLKRQLIFQMSAGIDWIKIAFSLFWPIVVGRTTRRLHCHN